MFVRLINVSTFLLLVVSCTKGEKKPPSLEDQGRNLYATHCTACHGANPKIDGTLGPAIFGSSLELLNSRILKGDYPSGYEPKRKTKQMVALPFLKDQIPALHAYLNKE